MCAPSVILQALAGLSRRDLLRLGASATLGMALPAASKANATEPAPRMIGASRMADLTHTLSPKFPVFPSPGAPVPLKVTTIATVEKNGYYANKWEVVEHFGTHLDAPCHFVAGQATLDQLPVQNLLAPAAVIDLSERAKKDADTMLTIDDVKAWEKNHGKLPAGAAVFLNSGWDARAGDPKAFLNVDRSETMHFPGFAPETCAFLLAERNIAGIGIDTLSFDIGASKEFKSHKTLLRGGKWAVECVANLGQVPPAGAHVIIGALKVAGASGGPVRLTALWA